MTTVRTGNGPVEIAGNTFRAAWAQNDEGFVLRVHENEAENLPHLSEGQATTFRPGNEPNVAVWVKRVEMNANHQTIGITLSLKQPG